MEDSEEIEDIALARAISDGQQTPRVDRDQVFTILEINDTDKHPNDID